MNFTSVSGKNWTFRKFENSDIKKYSEDYSLNEIVAKLLSIRKINIENIDLFLNPTIKNLLPNPFILKGMEKAVSRTIKAINEKGNYLLTWANMVNQQKQVKLVYEDIISLI